MLAYLNRPFVWCKSKNTAGGGPKGLLPAVFYALLFPAWSERYHKLSCCSADWTANAGGTMLRSTSVWEPSESHCSA